MSDDEVELSDAPHPRQTQVLYGHDEAEQTLLDAYRSGRIPHAWLIGGASGIGKATLAYRMARFVLAHPNPTADEVQNATSLAVADDNSAARKIASEAHSGLLVLKREINEKTGKLFTEIRVEDIRRSVPFFGSTAGEGGWRIAIIDAVDELNAAGANALLKILEEPPPQCLLLLVAHEPGRVMATIRSRTRRLLLRPLSQTDVARAVAKALGRSPTDPLIGQAAAASGGSAGRAIALLDDKTLALRERIVALLTQLPNPDPKAMHALGDAIGGTEPATLAAFVDTVNDWLSSRLDGRDTARMARFAAAWDRFNSSARDVDAYNLERKPLVFSTFQSLADASRG
jgi:DNA polymerase III subunit delta'